MYTLPEGHGVTPIKGGIQEAKTGCNGLSLCGEVARRDKDQIVHSNKACYGVFVRSLRKKKQQQKTTFGTTTMMTGKKE